MSCAPIDKIWSHPDHIKQYNEAAARVRRLVPSAVIPPPTDIRGLEFVLALLESMVGKAEYARGLARSLLGRNSATDRDLKIARGEIKLKQQQEIVGTGYGVRAWRAGTKS